MAWWHGATGAKDVALVVNHGPTYDSATVFTSNRAKAHPILWSELVVRDGVVEAVVLNRRADGTEHPPHVDTSSELTHFVCRTPGRWGAISRAG